MGSWWFYIDMYIYYICLYTYICTGIYQCWLQGTRNKGFIIHAEHTHSLKPIRWQNDKHTESYNPYALLQTDLQTNVYTQTHVYLQTYAAWTLKIYNTILLFYNPTTLQPYNPTLQPLPYPTPSSLQRYTTAKQLTFGPTTGVKQITMFIKQQEGQLDLKKASSRIGHPLATECVCVTFLTSLNPRAWMYPDHEGNQIGDIVCPSCGKPARDRGPDLSFILSWIRKTQPVTQDQKDCPRPWPTYILMVVVDPLFFLSFLVFEDPT